MVLFSCSTSVKEGETKAETLYNEAVQNTKEQRYLLAIEKLNRIKSKYPYSYYATPAELLQCDILFEQENYVESAAAYALFRELHPRHKNEDYVLWRIGESYFRQLPSTIDRDLTAIKDASKYLELLKIKYPRSQYVSKSTTRIKDMKDMVERHEKYVADFYYKTGVYESARSRYLYIINRFKNTELKNYAKIRVIKSSIELKEFKKCLDYGKKFASLKKTTFSRKFSGLMETCKKKTI